MQVSIKVNHQLDKCGDEFLDEEELELVFDTDCNSDYLKMEIGDLKDCYVRKDDLKFISKLLL